VTVIDDYADEFDRWVVGTDAHKAEVRAELVAHLHEADEAGDLQGTLARLGSPRSAAAAFSEARPLEGAPSMKRWWAALLDNAPLVGVGLAIPILALVDGAHGFTYSVVPFININKGLSGLQNIGVPLAIAWSVLVLAYFETRSGQTPGKRLLRLRTISVSGARPSFRQALVRRLTFLTGWFAIVDWFIGVLDPRHQRLFDRLAHTRVIDDPSVPAAAAA
jgi:uncharacterized RDD family membrane protein YckC